MRMTKGPLLTLRRVFLHFTNKNSYFFDILKTLIFQFPVSSCGKFLKGVDLLIICFLLKILGLSTHI